MGIITVNFDFLQFCIDMRVEKEEVRDILGLKYHQFLRLFEGGRIQLKHFIALENWAKENRQEIMAQLEIKNIDKYRKAKATDLLDED